MLGVRGIDRQELHAKSIRNRADTGEPFQDGELGPALVREISDSKRQESDVNRRRQRLLAAIDIMLSDNDVATLHKIASKTHTLEVTHEHVEDAFHEGTAAQPYAHLPLAAAEEGADLGDCPPHVLIVDCLSPFEFAQLACVLCVADAVDTERRLNP